MSHTLTYKLSKTVTQKKISKKEKIDKSTLGDIEALADLKKQLEDNEKSD